MATYFVNDVTIYFIMNVHGNVFGKRYHHVLCKKNVPGNVFAPKRLVKCMQPMRKAHHPLLLSTDLDFGKNAENILSLSELQTQIYPNLNLLLLKVSARLRFSDKN